MQNPNEWLGGYFVLRFFIGAIMASGMLEGMSYAFTDLGATEDWVLIYRYWIVAGMYVVAAGVWIGFVLITKPRPAPEGSKVHETKN